MPTGTNDFNQPLQTDPTSPGQGIAQTGNRLLMGGGSNSASGRWIWASGFEDGLASLSNVNLGTVESGVVFQGKQAIKLTTPAVINNNAWFYKYLFSQGRVYGLECVVQLIPGAAPGMEFSLLIEGPNKTSGTRSQAIVKLTSSNPGGNLYFGSTLVSDVTPYMPGGYFHYIKFVFDPYENKAKRIIFNDSVFELGDSPAPSYANTAKHLQFQVNIKTLTANVSSAIIDNCVITADEP